MTTLLVSVFLYLSYFIVIINLLLFFTKAYHGCMWLEYIGLGTIYGFSHPWASTNTSFDDKGYLFCIALC